MIKPKQENIIDRNTVEVEPGVKKLDLVNVLLELDARIKTIYSVIDEIKEVLQGQAAWSQNMDTWKQKMDPKIEIISEHEAKRILKG
jgi:hypothetical protein